MHDGCILKGGVGTGKSRTSLAYFLLSSGAGFSINGIGDHKPLADEREIYVLTTAKKRDDLDWEDEAQPFGISRRRELSIYETSITVDSWNNILKYKEVRDAFFIFDEQRLVGQGAWVKAFLEIAKHNRWILLSATPGDNWMDYIPVFIANGYYKNRTEFIRRHVVYSQYTKFPKVERYVETGRLAAIRSRVIVDMPFERHTTRVVRNATVSYDVELFQRVWKDRWHVYEDRPIKDVAELFAVARRVVNSDPSRLAAVMELYERHKKLIIFYNFNYELEMLRTLGSTLGVEVAEWNGHKHEAVPIGDRWLYLVQYTAGAEGWNCTSTDTTVFWSLNYSYKINEQAKGRTDRLNTPYSELYYHILRSGSPIDQGIVRALGGKKDFNEKDYVPKHVLEAFAAEERERLAA